MSRRANLSGQRVLVVEDDYWLATDTARALKLAGAEVAGPFPSEAAAIADVAESPTTCAVLDIKLYGGKSFDLARELKRRQVPFVFVTGYDREHIPDDLAGAPKLTKPVTFDRIIGALAEKLGMAPGAADQAPAAAAGNFCLGDRVYRRKGDEGGVVVAIDTAQFKVKWDGGGVSYFRHSAKSAVRKAP